MARDLFMEIYGRAPEQWELDQAAGMPEDQLRAVLEASIANWRAQQPAATPAAAPTTQTTSSIPDGISDGVLGWLGFDSRDDYRQSMADAAAARANDTSGFVTGGGGGSAASQAAPAPAPAPSSNRFVPQFQEAVQALAPVQKLTGAMPAMQALGSSIGYSATPQVIAPQMTFASPGNSAPGAGNYQSNLIASLRGASETMGQDGQSGVTFLPNQANTSAGNSSFVMPNMSGMTFNPNPANTAQPSPPNSNQPAANTIGGNGLVFNPQPTVLDEYDPTAIFQEIYGRGPTSSELEYARGKRPTDLRSTLERSFAEWQAAQQPDRRPIGPETRPAFLGNEYSGNEYSP